MINIISVFGLVSLPSHRCVPAAALVGPALRQPAPADPRGLFSAAAGLGPQQHGRRCVCECVFVLRSYKPFGFRLEPG